MDGTHFDRVMRSLAVAGGTRRTALSLLAGSALGGVVARLGLTEGVEAMPRSKHKGKRQAGQQRPDPPQAAGKGKHNKKKSGHRKSDKKKRKQDSPPPRLCPADCAELDGGRCCPDGSCVHQALCCPGERMCANGVCQPERQCCSDEYACADGSCVDRTLCCPEEKRCPSGACISADQCCADDLPPLCTECEEEACQNGSLVCRSTLECSPGWKRNTEECRCEQCEEVCPPQSLCSWPGCGDNERCIDGLCNSICTNPALPQLCCTQNEWTGTVYCGCTGADSICFNCGGSVCACRPGTEYCCDPSVHGPNCPPECLCP